jgi:ABC-type transport system substrate-binding protein
MKNGGDLLLESWLNVSIIGGRSTLKSFSWPVAAAGLLLLTGCQGHFSQNHANAADTFVWGLRFDIKTLDPANVTDTITSDVLRQFYENLVTIDSEGHATPQLADRFTVSADGLTYRFHLRSGVTFSNHQPLTADDVKFSLERVANPALSSSLSQSFLVPIQGAPARMEGKASAISGIQVLAPDSLQIVLTSKHPSFIKQLADTGLAILSKSGTPADRTIRSTNEMVGTGPFIASSFSSNTRLVAAGRTDYWNGHVEIKTLRIETVADATVAINRFRTGELDLMQITPADVQAVKSDVGLAPQLKLTPKAGTVYVQLSSHSFPALADIRVRQALAMSINRAKLCHDILHDSQTVATRFTPIGNGPTESLPYDPEQARKLLAGAGYPNGKGFPKIALNFAANGRQNPGAESIITDWRTNLGIDATTWGGASGALLALNMKGDVPAYFTGWTGDYSDLEDFLPQVAITAAPENHSGMSNSVLDVLLRQVVSSPDSPARAILMDKAEKLAMADAHLIPLYFVTDPELVSPRFTGIPFTPFGHLSLAKVQMASRR